MLLNTTDDIGDYFDPSIGQGSMSWEMNVLPGIFLVATHSYGE